MPLGAALLPLAAIDKKFPRTVWANTTKLQTLRRYSSKSATVAPLSRRDSKASRCCLISASFSRAAPPRRSHPCPPLGAAGQWHGASACRAWRASRDVCPSWEEQPWCARFYSTSPGYIFRRATTGVRQCLQLLPEAGAGIENDQLTLVLDLIDALEHELQAAAAFSIFA